MKEKFSGVTPEKDNKEGQASNSGWSELSNVKFNPENSAKAADAEKSNNSAANDAALPEWNGVALEEILSKAKNDEERSTALQEYAATHQPRNLDNIKSNKLSPPELAVEEYMMERRLRAATMADARGDTHRARDYVQNILDEMDENGIELAPDHPLFESVEELVDVYRWNNFKVAAACQNLSGEVRNDRFEAYAASHLASPDPIEITSDNLNSVDTYFLNRRIVGDLIQARSSQDADEARKYLSDAKKAMAENGISFKEGSKSEDEFRKLQERYPDITEESTQDPGESAQTTPAETSPEQPVAQSSSESSAPTHETTTVSNAAKPPKPKGIRGFFKKIFGRFSKKQSKS